MSVNLELLFLKTLPQKYVVGPILHLDPVPWSLGRHRMTAQRRDCRTERGCMLTSPEYIRGKITRLSVSLVA
jgi:hypothetical protein